MLCSCKDKDVKQANNFPDSSFNLPAIFICF